ncbi:hypothetical protein NDU88_011763 [Pleurodeles waltl]|uniref:Uncharacterized protein n=1 Tax=Pleurodeles waltl TaxID=8319 RepID=A0AAV7R0Y4_PLEWA|nr:hypothetical protein NDU88_011763 [Pleurodeles waltl]
MCVKSAQGMLLLAIREATNENGAVMAGQAKTLSSKELPLLTARKPHLTAGRRRKPRRVLYPAQVRKYLPPEETDLARRWLFFFGAIILMQVCMEEAGQQELHVGDALLGPEPDGFLSSAYEKSIVQTVARFESSLDLATHGHLVKEQFLAHSDTYCTCFSISNGEPACTANSTVYHTTKYTNPVGGLFMRVERSFFEGATIPTLESECVP